MGARGTMSRRSSLLRASAVAMSLLGGLALPSEAQRVSGLVLRPDSVSAAAQVLVEWRTRRGAVQRVLTDGAGRFSIQLPREDSVYLRILRPGYRPQEATPLLVLLGETATARIVLRDQAIVLSAMRVAGESACTGRSDAPAWTLLEQARTAILTASLAERDPLLKIDAVEYEGDATPAGAILLRDESVRRSGTSSQASQAQRDSIFRFGYVRRSRSDTTYYHAPTPDVIVDERFRSRYCAALVPADSSPDGLIGVRFQPARRPGPGIADVTGVFWLDDDRYLLSRVEFEYFNVPVHHRVEGLGGYLEFAVLPSGHWLLREWLFRMPNLIATHYAPITVLRPDGSYPTNRAGEPIRSATPVRSATGLWAHGRIVYRVESNGRVVHTDSSGASLLERATPRR